MEPICLQGRTLTGDDLAMVRALIAQHPDWHRTALSRHLCELWNWRNSAGRIKDMIPVKTVGFFSNPFLGRQRFGTPPWL